VVSTSHDIYAKKVDDNSWQANFERNNFLPNSDFNLQYEVKAEEMAVNFLSTRPDPEKDGYFVLMLSPQEIIEQTDIANRDIVFIMDTSGSMGGHKIQQTKESFRFFINKLNENDRFAIIDFSDTARIWKPELMPATEEYRQEAKLYIESLRAHGGTNIYESLLQALKTFDGDEKRTKAIIFLTDGEASVGITSTPQIVNDFKKHNVENIRTFTLGVGQGVNKSLLGKIAMENRGEALYLDARENLETNLKGFYEAISTPLLVDLKLDFGSMQISEMYPEVLPNVYKGTQIVVTGRYKNSGEAAITLTGLLNQETRTFPISANFVGETSENPFVARFWARTKADELLKQIKVYGEKPELKQQVIALSKEYQFATPYTSFIAVSAEQVPQVKQQAKTSGHSAAYANIRASAAPKRVVVQKTKAKSVSLWGAAGFVPFAVAVPNFRKAREQARHKACYANMRVLQGAVEMYNMDHEEMITVLTEREIQLLIEEKYLKSDISRPEQDCVYGTIGDLSQNGMICCAIHGTVEENSTSEKAVYADGANGYVTYEQVVAQTPWTTRIWNDYLADAVSLLINVPLFILGLAFSLYLFYHILALPFKIFKALFSAGSANE
jgi:Ca-activated chloride channel family protein